IHERAHIDLGHLAQGAGESAGNPNAEYEADKLAGAALVHFMRASGGSWALGAWACDLVLTAFQLLYETVGLFTIGTAKVRINSQTHPSPLARRNAIRKMALRAEGTSLAPKFAAHRLQILTNSFEKQLWRRSRPGFREGAAKREGAE